jgi:hypothetical protein
MSMVERFQQLLPNIARIKRIVKDDESAYWEAYDTSSSLLGYAFHLDVPRKTQVDMPDAEEFDKYEILGIASIDLKILKINIAPHPEYAGELWAAEIVEPKYGQQYLGLTAEEIKLSPDGKIDAVSEGTISSKLITEAVMEKLIEIDKEIHS